MNKSAIGTWENKAPDCSGILKETSTSLVEQWTSSSENYSNVEFRAYIMVGNVTYLQTITFQSSSNVTTVTYTTSTPMTTRASSNMTTMNNAATTPKTTHDNNNTTSSVINNRTTQISTSAAKKSTPQNAAGMVIGFKPLFQALEDLDIKDEWTVVKEAVYETCEKVLRKRTFKHKEWIRPGTMEITR
ncbi:placenta-expressed transcript 1 protein-like isoform X1 [Mobula hypostoma]|uniref:placenta-expressed transcript 1 protein-like isoform X1 n=1 Tax=Mobula hypostoma TaxID=723540 RepID=UPI002FC2ADC7